jgi:nucleoside 2-deoxyribosyltransferase
MIKSENIDDCLVCKTEKAITYDSDFDGIHQKCPRCGEFKLTGTAISVNEYQKLDDEGRAMLSGWIRNQNTLGSIPQITSDNIKPILATHVPPLVERSQLLLLEAEKGLRRLGEEFNINESRFLAATYSSNSNDVNYLFKMLSSQGLADYSALGGICTILPDGYIRLDELRSKISASDNGFVAMSFLPELNEVYADGLQLGILDAGYESVRMDRIEHINRIDDEIIRQINTSKFLVADFTGHRGGVYFEAGYALGIGLPVFWTCRRSDMSELHFDIRQFNCIDWESPKDLAKRLQVRLEAVLGKGPKARYI